MHFYVSNLNVIIRYPRESMNISHGIKAKRKEKKIVSTKSRNTEIY